MWNKHWKATLKFTLIGFALFELYDQLFVLFFNIVCEKQHTFESTIPVYRVALALLCTLLPTFLIRTKLVLCLYCILTSLVIMSTVIGFCILFSTGIDPFGECTTSQGDHYDQTLPLVGQVMVFGASIALAYALLGLELVFFAGRYGARRIRQLLMRALARNQG